MNEYAQLVRNILRLTTTTTPATPVPSPSVFQRDVFNVERLSQNLTPSRIIIIHSSIHRVEVSSILFYPSQQTPQSARAHNICMYS